MTNPKTFSFCSSKKIYLCFSIVVFVYIIYVNLNNQAQTTKQSPSWKKLGGSDETPTKHVSYYARRRRNFFRGSPPSFDLPPQAPQEYITLKFPPLSHIDREGD